MKILKLIVITALIFGCKDKRNVKNVNFKSKELIVFEQNFDKALSLAAQKDKLLFIDFYTTWCVPCKKLDNEVFQNDSIKDLLGKDFVLLKYDAENDSVFHLSKKHHINSYPTGIILNKDGYVLNRKYGFTGQDPASLQKNVIEFAEESIALNKENKVLNGYSNKIILSRYPKFYVDYINRVNTKINHSQLSDYLINTKDKFSEAYFSTLIYFGQDVPVNIADEVLHHKQRYINLYGKKDVEVLLYFLTSVKFNVAISEKSQKKYDEAVVFTKKALSKEWVDDILPEYKKDYLKAQNRWSEVFAINKKLKDNGLFDNDYINHFSWQVYKKCDNQDVINKCIAWMKEVTSEEPTYIYLDTYAHLLYKSGNENKAKDIALLAIEIGKGEGKKTKESEMLINKLSQ
ncbi:thioredoxin family protein [Mesoflavibacter zeaxanthinifaciens]|uniref:thioredoxin family protein n=1 Tax=Mesoflavibacter zeaxanthinifaciens TaxID=393060 RepID=UPI003A95864A